MEISLVLTNDSGTFQTILGQFIETSVASTLQDRLLAQSAATDAAASSGSASASATSASSSAAAASTSASNASSSATNASASATTATTQAGNAATSATNASNSATAASTSATNAANSASAAATSASNAAATLANALVKANNLSDVSNTTTARGNIGAAKSGANSDITSLTGLTTALSIAQGGTGGATAAAARAALGAAATGSDLSQFAATTSAQLAGVISDETGTGKLVFGTAPTLNQPNIVGNTTGSAAAAGSVGELLTANASGTSVPNASSFNAVSLTLTPGVWDVSGAIQYLPVSVTSFNSIIAGISTVSGTLGAVGSNYVIQGALSSPGANHAPTPTLRISVAANTTVYLVGTLSFTGGSCTANSTIRAARVI